MYALHQSSKIPRLFYSGYNYLVHRSMPKPDFRFSYILVGQLHVQYFVVIASPKVDLKMAAYVFHCTGVLEHFGVFNS